MMIDAMFCPLCGAEVPPRMYSRYIIKWHCRACSLDIDAIEVDAPPAEYSNGFAERRLEPLADVWVEAINALPLDEE